jgi:signal transduction histidine kinase
MQSEAGGDEVVNDLRRELAEAQAQLDNLATQHSRLVEEVQASKRELQETLDYQTAASEVLGVISRSPTELQQVLHTIARTSQRLCEADRSSVWRLVDGAFELAAISDHSPAVADYMARAPVPADRTSTAGRCVLEKRTLHIHDRLNEPGLPPLPQSYASGARTLLCVPLLREGEPIGVVRLSRDKIAPFAPSQIALVETFADQAVIAIENTRLFEAEQSRTREVEVKSTELAQSLEYQTAIAEVLSVISRSPRDLSPVLEAIGKIACRLCAAYDVSILLRRGDKLRLMFTSGPIGGYPLQHDFALTRGYVMGRAVIDAEPVHIADLRAEIDEYPEGSANAAELGHRTILAVPLLHTAQAIGVIVLRRLEVNPFTQSQVALLKTFADQAVIAIENTRLFEEVQARTRELSVALEQQTATSEVLGAISSSRGELQPVFETMLANATHLCAAKFGNLLLYEGDVFRFVAMYGAPPAFAELRRRNPVVPAEGTLARIAATKQVQQIADFKTQQTYLDRKPGAIELGDVAGARTLLSVPMLKDNELIGVIGIYRQEVRPFSDKQIDLVTNFARQAVIAIENARLLNELRESLQQQTATADVLKVISRSALDLQRVLDALVESAARVCNAYDTAMFQVLGDGLRLVAHHGQIPLAGPVGQHTIPLVRGLTSARAVIERRTIHVGDILAEADEYPESHKNSLQQGYRTTLGVPLVHAGEAIGAMLIRRAEVRPFTEREIELVNTFADQAVIAIENTRLFDEVQARTRELAKTVEDLEIASQHKNQFVANMSHELRTPLAAILGYAELIQEGFYEPQGPKSLDALTRIRSNGKHLLGLINTVLDIAKIESGQFTLNMAEYAIESVVETVLSATESLAQNKKLTLNTDIAKSLPIGLGDEQRLTQVLLNLVGNAIKFTDAGEVRVTAKAVNGRFNVTVADTGPGIPPAEQGRIFEQFHQVDSSLTKAKGGTGLGLAIAKQIVEMHGGRIWVESTLGKGSTFRMELPTRAATT